MAHLIRENFELTREESALLFGLEYLLTENDIKQGEQGDLSSRKEKWLKRWTALVSGEKTKGMAKVSIDIPEKDLLAALKKVKPTKLKIIFLETLLYSPYFNLNVRDLTQLGKNAFDAKSRTAWNNQCLYYAGKVGIDSAILQEALEGYSEALNDIGGNSNFLKGLAIVVVAAIAVAVTGGMLAPALGGLVGSLMGLSGAAATSAGLAFLGGGAIAAGGFGMAGGTFVLIGGGALIGAAGAGLATTNLFTQHKVVLTQLAKLDTVINEFLSELDHYEDILREVMDIHSAARKQLQKELERPTKDTDRKENLGKSVAYYENAIKRLNKRLLEMKL